MGAADTGGMENARNRRARRAVFVMGMMAVAGVLIWSKLRLATNIPRSAYAVPEDRSVEPVEPVEQFGTVGPGDAASGAGHAGAAGVVPGRVDD